MCQQSTDFHFADLSQQFEQIEENVLSLSESTSHHSADELTDCVSLRSGGSLSSDVSRPLV